MIIDEILKRINGFRKLFFGLLGIIVASVFLVSQHITGDNFTSIIIAAISGYMAGNVGEKLVEAGKELWQQKKK